MKYDFDQIIDRRNTASYKWDQLEALFGGEDVLPLWVADMDFPCAEPIVDVLVQRAEAGIYGYTIRTQEWFDAVIGWYKRRHGWMTRQEWILMSPSVVTSLSLAVEQFTEPGSGVVLQSPVYYPFYDVIRSNGRKVLKNSLNVNDGKYEMDYEGLEAFFKNGSKLMLLCNPHNPGGRVWTRPELARLDELCAKYGVTVVSDEIHCDLVFAPNRHVPYASVSEHAANTTVTLLAPTKTFNIPGVQSSIIVAQDSRMRNQLSNRIRALSLHMQNYFAHSATIAAYTACDEWLDQLLPYIKGNIDYAVSFLREKAPMLQPMAPEGTYLLWVDATRLGLNAKGMQQLMNAEAKVAFNEGSMFGDEGAGFVRINCACPRSILEEALERFVGAVRRRSP